MGTEELLQSVEVSTRVANMEISVEDSQKATQWPSYTTTQHIPERPRRLDTYSVMYIAALVTIARKWDGLDGPQLMNGYENVVCIHDGILFSYEKYETFRRRDGAGEVV